MYALLFFLLKYSDLSHSHIFIPVAIETMGVWGLGAADLVSALGRRLPVDSGDRLLYFLSSEYISLYRKALHSRFLERLYRGLHHRIILS